MKTNREIIENAIKKNTKVSFFTGSCFEKNVEIVGYNTDDVANREFQYKVKNGNVYTRFENNVLFAVDNFDLHLKIEMKKNTPPSKIYELLEDRKKSIVYKLIYETINKDFFLLPYKVQKLSKKARRNKTLKINY